MQNGTGPYARAKGTGTYTFDTKISGNKFTLLKLTLNGSLN